MAKGCTCFAYSESECGCDGADWRSSREVELEALYRAEVKHADILASQLNFISVLMRAQGWDKQCPNIMDTVRAKLKEHDKRRGG